MTREDPGCSASSEHLGWRLEPLSSENCLIVAQCAVWQLKHLREAGSVTIQALWLQALISYFLKELNVEHAIQI